MIIIKTDHGTIHKNRNSKYNKQYRNYSQSPHRNNNHYNNSKHRYRSSTPKNQINCASSDTESDTENTISVNMITVENDYEPIIYEQPFTSHIEPSRD